MRAFNMWHPRICHRLAAAFRRQFLAAAYRDRLPTADRVCLSLPVVHRRPLLSLKVLRLLLMNVYGLVAAI